MFKENFSRFREYLKISLIGISGASLLWAIRQTLSFKILMAPGQSANWSGEAPWVVAFWHSQQLMMPWFYKDSKPASGADRKPIFALISQSKDGRSIAKAMKILGLDSIAGSSSRGGKEALVQLVRKVKAGCHVAITPDGPVGPVNEVKVGALKISQLTGAQIVPVALAAEKYWTFKSWDRMTLPKPFSKVVVVTGPTLSVPRDSTDQEVTEIAGKLKIALDSLTLKAKELVVEDEVRVGSASPNSW